MSAAAQTDSVCMLARSLFLRPSARTLYIRYYSPSALRSRDLAHSCMAVQQQSWSLPTQKVAEPVLKVYNSLTRTKVGRRMHDITSLWMAI